MMAACSGLITIEQLTKWNYLLKVGNCENQISKQTEKDLSRNDSKAHD
jgi:hypothetical protein